jgi:tetratricopeptide (TPR) repeat protein
VGRRELISALVLCTLATRSLRAEPTSEDLQRAEELYKQGLVHYDLAEYDAAIDEFKQAYELSKAPALLYNLGQAYRFRKPRDCSLALWYYRAFLRSQPTPSQRPAVERVIAEMERCVSAAPPPESPQPAAPPPVTPAPPTPTPIPAQPPAEATASRLPLVAIGGGVLVAGAGATLMWWSNDRYDWLRHECAPICTQSQISSAQTAQTVGVVLTVAGAGVAAAGALYWMLHRDQRAADRAATIVPISHGLAWRSRF